MKRLVSRVVDELLYGYSRLCMTDGFCAILCLHRVAQLDERRLRYNDHLKVSPQFLEGTITDLKRRGYSFLSMDEVLDNIVKGTHFNKNVALTFDDGYRDVFENAVPVLKSENVPAVVYVATGLATGAGVPWWDVLEDFLLEHDSIVMPDGSRAHTDTLTSKCDVFLALRNWVFTLPRMEIPSAIAAFCGMDGDALMRYRRLFADGALLRQYHCDSVVSLGCHTHRHIPCGILPKAEVDEDLSESAAVLAELGVKARHFAFPYGADVRDPKRFVDSFESLGIETCATTFCGVAQACSNRYFLPRIAVSQYAGFSERAVFQSRAADLKVRIKKAVLR